MPPTTPYTKHLGDREPIASMRETSERIRSLTSGWSPQQFERTYAPGKWTARPIQTSRLLVRDEHGLGKVEAHARLIADLEMDGISADVAVRVSLSQVGRTRQGVALPVVRRPIAPINRKVLPAIFSPHLVQLT